MLLQERVGPQRDDTSMGEQGRRGNIQESPRLHPTRMFYPGQTYDPEVCIGERSSNSFEYVRFQEVSRGLIRLFLASCHGGKSSLTRPLQLACLIKLT